MICKESNWFLYFIIIINAISIIGCLVIIWTFNRFSKLSPNPGKIIVRISYLQMIYSMILLVSQFYINNDYNNNDQNNNDCNFHKSWQFPIGHSVCKYLGFASYLLGIIFDYHYYLLIYYIYITLIKTDKKITYENRKKYMEYIVLIILIGFAIFMIFQNDYQLGLLGNCDVQFNYQNESSIKTLFLIVQFISLGFLFLLSSGIVIIYNRFDEVGYDTLAQNQEASKFQKKYLKGFMKNNLFYIGVFVIIRIFPTIVGIILSLINEQDNYYNIQQVLLAIISIGGILLFFVRTRDPLVKKYLKRLFCGIVKRPNLQNRITFNNSELQSQLLAKNIKSTDDKQSLEITFFDNSNLKSRSSQNNTLSTKEQQSSIISSHIKLRQRSELLVILQIVKTIMHPEEYRKNLSERDICPYSVNRMRQKKLSIQYKNREIESKFKEFSDNLLQFGSVSGPNNSNSIYFFDNFVTNWNQQYPVQINCIYYGSEQFCNFLQGLLNIDLERILKSVSISNNIQKLIETTEWSQYLTQDGLVNIELISKKTKFMLTKGGGLLKLLKGWQKNFGEQSTDVNTHIPLIIGLMSIQIDQGKCLNVLVKLNPLLIDYPLTMDVWEKKLMKKDFDKLNIIRWIELRPNFMFQKYSATAIDDGKFKIRLDESDFKFAQNEQIQIIENIQRDLMIIQHLGQLILTFVYFKYSTSRLLSIIKHEKNFDLLDSDKSTYSNNESDIIFITNNRQQILGKYELENKLGYVKIFFDQTFSISHQQVQEDIEQQSEKLLQRIFQIL